MSLELLNTFGTLLTVAIIAATAIAAIVQLRHMRAGNQINALLTIDEKILGRSFQGALTMIQAQLRPALEDPIYREYHTALTRVGTPPNVSLAYKELRDAATLVGNRYEELGLLIKKGTIESSLFLDFYSTPVVVAWKELENCLAFWRAAQMNDAIWENFEYLAVLAEDWLKNHPTTYPKGIRRKQLHNPWPVSPTPATA